MQEVESFDDTTHVRQASENDHDVENLMACPEEVEASRKELFGKLIIRFSDDTMTIYKQMGRAQTFSAYAVAPVKLRPRVTKTQMSPMRLYWMAHPYLAKA